MKLKEMGNNVIPIDKEIGTNVLDHENILNILNDVETVYHLAYYPNVLYSIGYPYETHKNNVDGTLSVLEACRKKDVDIVFASSFAAKKPESPYGLHKKICEDYCKLYSDLYGMKCIVVRYSNVYGGNNYLRTKTSVIAKFINLLNKSTSIDVYGDGNQTRDFVHIDDIINGTIKCTSTNKKFEIYEICTGVPTSVNDIINILNRHYELPIIVGREPARSGEILHSVGDHSLAKHDFGYEPKTSLDDGISKLYNNKSN